MSNPHGEVKRRDQAFAEKIVTRIWDEQATAENPYIAESCFCHGYDLLELAKGRSIVEVLFLLFRGELPSPDEARRLETLMILLINPGPRHPATRAAMNAGVCKTERVQILPVALTILGGELGAQGIEVAMRFLRKERKHDPIQTAARWREEHPRPREGDWSPLPGFGTHYGGIDRMPQKMVALLLELPGGKDHLLWGESVAQALHPYGLGWLVTGMAAAIFADLGFQPGYGPGLFQLLAAPGLLAHGLELANKPLTAMPFIKDEDYIIEKG